MRRRHRCIRAPEEDHHTMQPVLVVDDEEPIRSAVAEMLAEAGYSVAQARDGGEALAILESAPGDDLPLVLLDMMMPVMTGRELLDAIRARPRLAGVRVVALTAMGYSGCAVRDVPVLEKPFTIEMLLRTVKAASGQARSSAG
jgi:CheY-like chemotaxis protein